MLEGVVTCVHHSDWSLTAFDPATVNVLLLNICVLTCNPQLNFIIPSLLVLLLRHTKQVALYLPLVGGCAVWLVSADASTVIYHYPATC